MLLLPAPSESTAASPAADAGAAFGSSFEEQTAVMFACMGKLEGLLGAGPRPPAWMLGDSHGLPAGLAPFAFGPSSTPAGVPLKLFIVDEFWSLMNAPGNSGSPSYAETVLSYIRPRGRRLSAEAEQRVDVVAFGPSAGIEALWLDAQNRSQGWLLLQGAATHVELIDESANGLVFTLTRVTGLAKALELMHIQYPQLQFEGRVVLVPLGPTRKLPRHSIHSLV